MGSIACEICGSTDLIKQDEYFVCQKCGSKYSVETVRKMVGTEPDSAGQSEKDAARVNEYLEMAEKEFSSNSFSETEKFCDLATEIDPKNSRAWLLKAKAMLCHTDYKSDKMEEVRGAFSRAIECANDQDRPSVEDETITNVQAFIYKLWDKKWEAFANTMQRENYDVELAILPQVMTINATHFEKRNGLKILTPEYLYLTFDSVIKHHKAVYEVFLSAYKRAYSISNNYHGEAWDCGQNLGMNIATFGQLVIISFQKVGIFEKIENVETAEIAIQMLDQAINILQDVIAKAGYVKKGVDYFNENLVKPLRTIRGQISVKWDSKIADAKKQKIENYWNTHADEKRNLEDKIQVCQEAIKSNEEKISAINSALNNMSEKKKYQDIDREMSALRLKISGMGFFKRKEKAQLEAELSKLQPKYDQALEEYDKKERVLRSEKASAEKNVSNAKETIKKCKAQLEDPSLMILKKN